MVSSKCEGISLHPRIEKLDGKGVVLHFPGLANQLIEALFTDDALAFCIQIDATASTWRVTIDRHAETHGLAVHARTEHQMQIARMKAERDLSVRCICMSEFSTDSPGAGERPVVQLKL